MKWNHLPNPGGLYQQNPDLLLKFQYIFAQRAEAEDKKRRQEEREAKSKGRSPVAGRRRR